MKRQTVIIQVTPTVECWGNFKKWCEAKGVNHRSMLTLKKAPTIDKPIQIEDWILHRVQFM